MLANRTEGETISPQHGQEDLKVLRKKTDGNLNIKTPSADKDHVTRPRAPEQLLK